MSIQENNIKIVQQLYSFFTNRDIPAILTMLSTEVVWGEPANPFNPAAGTRHGHSGFME
jgi:ketosteroid isomerase-like protein